ncbi:MAG: D-alanyl-D-alanine carboxypeptidase, partial [Actinomycetota bacterium]|nr:D-alanyl-D-alanine carboxypeptidase [Actinomycetota bacterium]
LPIASTTKVMVALMAFEEGVDLDEEVTISEQAESYVGFTYSNIGLIKGEQVSVRELLVAALVPSGTDAVYALAEHLGGGGGEAGVENFVDEMNRNAESMGLENTHFTNPAGLDHKENYSSARDLTEIARAAMEYPEFVKIVNREEGTISTDSREIEFFTTNNLLYTYDAANGVKTGTSPAAGPCLVASAKEGEESYVAVVLDAAEDQYRFEAAETILSYGFGSYELRPLVEEGQVYEQLTPPFRPEESVGLAAAEDVTGLAGPGLEAERRVTEKEAPPAAKKGQELGGIELLINGQSIGNSPLVTERGYEEASLWRKIRYWTGRTFDRISGWVSGLAGG